MLVNKHWEKTVSEAENLWEKLEVVRKWGLGGVGVEGVRGAGPLLLSRLLQVAKEVRFSCHFDHAKEHMTWVGGALDLKFTSLELPMDTLRHPFLTSFASTFLHLKSLAFIGRQVGKVPLCVSDEEEDEDEEELHDSCRVSMILLNLLLSSALISPTS